jgi:Rrf2 family protein
MLSMKAKYALRALLRLAEEHGKGPVLISDLAEREHIPKKFLELILLDLKNKGILHSKKGKGGGYLLGKPPEAIAIGQVIRLLDGPLAPLPCVSQIAYRKCEECPDEKTCGIRLVMKEVRDATAEILDGTSLARLLKQAKISPKGKEDVEVVPQKKRAGSHLKPV